MKNAEPKIPPTKTILKAELNFSNTFPIALFENGNKENNWKAFTKAFISWAKTFILAEIFTEIVKQTKSFSQLTRHSTNENNPTLWKSINLLLLSSQSTSSII